MRFDGRGPNEFGWDGTAERVPLLAPRSVLALEAQTEAVMLPQLIVAGHIQTVAAIVLQARLGERPWRQWWRRLRGGRWTARLNAQHTIGIAEACNTQSVFN